MTEQKKRAEFNKHTNKFMKHFMFNKRTNEFNEHS